MKLAETHYDNTETGCCAPLDTARWDGKTVIWDDRPFLYDHVHEFLHVPLDFGSVITRDNEAIEAAGAFPLDPLWITEEVSPWGSDVYVAIDREVPGATMDRLTGTFLTKVFEGPYRDVRRWVSEMGEYVASEGHTVEKIYFYHATCTKCAKHFGKNQVVLFAKVG
jgi:hypothetical protein